MPLLTFDQAMAAADKATLAAGPLTDKAIATKDPIEIAKAYAFISQAESAWTYVKGLAVSQNHPAAIPHIDQQYAVLESYRAKLDAATAKAPPPPTPFPSSPVQQPVPAPAPAPAPIAIPVPYPAPASGPIVYAPPPSVANGSSAGWFVAGALAVFLLARAIFK